jgi:ribosomal protein L37AE/L43A
LFSADRAATSVITIRTVSARQQGLNAARWAAQVEMVCGENVSSCYRANLGGTTQMLIYKTCPACAGEPLMNKIFECDTCGQKFASFADRELSLGTLVLKTYYTEALYKSA